jgi:hypothetical protein
VGEFFTGWRRKAGCVTLAMALVLTVGWMRSRSYQDLLWIQSSYGNGIVYSASGGINVAWRSGTTFTTPYGRISLQIDEGEHPGDVPYWRLVLPLTLLSAWLLLIKPRPAKPAKESNRA